MSARPIPKPGAISGTTSTHDDEDWRHRAACLNPPEDLWFPADWEREAERNARIADAKAVCATCPVTDPCLNWALNNRIDHGVWGGLDEDERSKLKRRNTRRISPTVATRPSGTRTRPTAERPVCGTPAGRAEHARKRERLCDACRASKAAA